MNSFLKQSLIDIRASGRHRRLAVRDQNAGIDFSSNDYLGLARDPALIEAACATTRQWGAGSSASRLITGNLELHEALERDVSAWKGTEAALLFNSGYHANIGAIPALAQEGDLILSDVLNHASLIDGCRLSKAETRIFPHNDMNALEDRLQKAGARRRLIVTESVFSMDGDLAPLADILALAERYDAWVYLDEAHATGVLGRNGAGLAEALNIVNRDRLIQMGTLGKALGSFGAYIAGSQLLKEFLINRARSFIFATALPPAPVAAARKAIELVRSRPEIRERLWRNITSFYEAARAFLPLEKPQAAIIPVILGDESKALAVSASLRERGFWVQAIRPPTVPAGTSRLRITISAGHKEEQIEGLVEAIGNTIR